MRTPTLTLIFIFVALLLDTLFALPFNLYGLGREPLLFAIACFALALLLWWQKGQWQSFLVLLSCCLWLTLSWRSHNGWDFVVLPLLLITLLLRVGSSLLRLLQTKILSR